MSYGTIEQKIEDSDIMFSAITSANIPKDDRRVANKFDYDRNLENLIFSLLFNKHLIIPDSSMIFFDSMRKILRKYPIILENNLIYPMIRESANKSFKKVSEIGEVNKIGDRPTDTKNTGYYNEDYGAWLEKKLNGKNKFVSRDMGMTFTRNVVDITNHEKNLNVKEILKGILEKLKENKIIPGLTPVLNELKFSQVTPTQTKKIKSIIRDAYTITPSATLNDRYFKNHDSLIRLNVSQNQFGTIVDRLDHRLSYDYTEVIKNQNFKTEYALDTSIFTKNYIKSFDMEFIINDLRKSPNATKYFDAINKKNATLEDKLAELFQYVQFIDETLYAKKRDSEFNIKKVPKITLNFVQYAACAAMKIILPTNIPPLEGVFDLLNERSLHSFFIMTEYYEVQRVREERKRLNEAAKMEAAKMEAVDKLTRVNLSVSNS